MFPNAIKGMEIKDRQLYSGTVVEVLNINVPK